MRLNERYDGLRCCKNKIMMSDRREYAIKEK